MLYRDTATAMPAPPPHDGPCKRCGSEDDVSTLGRYRGLCPSCRKDVAAEHAAQRQAAPADDADPNAARAPRQPQLSSTVQQLVPLARNLEKALDHKKTAHAKARSELGKFRDGLQLVSRVAQSLIGQERAGEERQ